LGKCFQTDKKDINNPLSRFTFKLIAGQITGRRLNSEYRSVSKVELSSFKNIFFKNTKKHSGLKIFTLT